VKRHTDRHPAARVRWSRLARFEEMFRSGGDIGGGGGGRTPRGCSDAASEPASDGGRLPTVLVVDEVAWGESTRDRLRRRCAAAAAREGVDAAGELSLTLVDRPAIAALNAEHMGKEGPTDVLAFPIGRPPVSEAGEAWLVGDVVLCPGVATDQANEQGRDPDRELDMLVVHGVLHLLGWDHQEAGEAEAMFARTNELLQEAVEGGVAT